MERDFKAFEQQSVFGRLLRKNPVKKEMAMLARDGRADKTHILKILSGLADFQKKSQANLQWLQSMSMLLPEIETQELTQALVKERTELVKNAVASAGSQKRLNTLIRLIQSPDYEAKMSRFEKAMADDSSKLLDYLELTALDESELLTDESGYFENLDRKVTEIESSLDLLRDWLNFKAAQKTAEELDLSAFTQYYYNGQVSDLELLPAFKKSVLRKELRRRLEGEGELLNITGHSLDEKTAYLK